MALGAAGDLAANVVFTLSDFNEQGYWDFLTKGFGINAIFCKIGVSAGYYLLSIMDQLPVDVRTGAFTSGLIVSPYIAISAVF